MEPATSETPGNDLRAVMAHAEDEARQLLSTEGAKALDVVSWLSAHLAALDLAVFPVARESLPDGAEIVSRHREIAARLTRTLRVVERHHSGDVLASGLNADRMIDNLRELVDEHVKAQAQLVERLVQTLDDAARTELIAAYETALAHAPTRPHPHLHRGGLMFRLDALRDRVLDAMDGRHAPVPRFAKDRIVPGRWGSYLLGQPHDPDRSED
jgi:hypothetical protein